MMIMQGRMVAALILGIISLQANAIPAFTTPDFPLPLAAGKGLVGSIWTNVNVDTLAAARTYISAHTPDAVFLSSQVDYPQGAPTTVTVPGTNFSQLLGTDAGTLNPAIGGQEINNSIMRFSGYFRVDNPNSTFQFDIGSDDGSALLFQGIEVFTNDGIHPFPGPAAPVDVTFQDPGLYAMDILFFESEPVDFGIAFTFGNAVDGNVVPQSLLYPSPVPEPATISLLGLGLAGLAYRQRRKGARPHLT